MHLQLQSPKGIVLRAQLKLLSAIETKRWIHLQKEIVICFFVFFLSLFEQRRESKLSFPASLKIY